MPFEARNLSVLAYVNGFTHWHYRTAAPAADLLRGEYFNPAAQMLRAGDIIFVNASVDGAIEALSLHVRDVDGPTAAIEVMTSGAMNTTGDAAATEHEAVNGDLRNTPPVTALGATLAEAQAAIRMATRIMDRLPVSHKPAASANRSRLSQAEKALRRVNVQGFGEAEAAEATHA